MRSREAAVAEEALASTPQPAADHFRLHVAGAVLHLRDHVLRPLGLSAHSPDDLGFLDVYHRELERLLPPARRGGTPTERWWEAVVRWESGAAGHLPLRALRDAAALDPIALTVLFIIGLVEEDARFGLLFEAIQGASGQRRATASLLTDWWSDRASRAAARSALRRLLDLQLVEVVNTDAPRLEWALQTNLPIWDALWGEQSPQPVPWAAYRPPSHLVPVDRLVLSGEQRRALDSLPALLTGREATTLVVRGPAASGRRTLVGSVARACGWGLLHLEGLGGGGDQRWRMVGPLATALHAIPLVTLDPGPGETIEVSFPPAFDGPMAVVLGRHGGLTGPGVDGAVVLWTSVPGARTRLAHWNEGFADHRVSRIEVLADRFRMTGGNIRRTARMAIAQSAMTGNPEVRLEDVRAASRLLNRQHLDTLASAVETGGDWSDLAVVPSTGRELLLLEQRCRHREGLQEAGGRGAPMDPGVRALFTGPSGTGKSLAARLLASVLGKDLYAVDLSTVVNKYLGETEKNLNSVLTRAEELDVILLLDEGDALLTRRTEVATANDRYANLETNFLLQRMESYEGILIVTTNAGDRIDPAFQRRMDVVVEFRAPDESERWEIWQLHLARSHAVDPAYLETVATRCALTGGQIRNAVLHASLLALTDGGLVTSAHVEAAVQREYRKVGGVCPLRPFGTD